MPSLPTSNFLGVTGLAFSCRSLLAGIALMLFSLAGVAGSATQRETDILHLLKHDCGSCHGMTLRGGLGPPLLPDRMKLFTEEQLAATILYGRPGTPMPPWKPFLTEPEARWLAGLLIKGIEP